MPAPMVSGDPNILPFHSGSTASLRLLDAARMTPIFAFPLNRYRSSLTKARVASSQSLFNAKLYPRVNFNSTMSSFEKPPKCTLEMTSAVK